MKRGNGRAILTMLGGVATFALLDSGLKHLSMYLPTMQVMFLRGAASLPFVVIAVAMNRAWAELRMHRPWLYLVRGLLTLLVLWTFIFALSLQSLSYTYAIYMSAPLIVAILAGPMLGEKVPPRRWFAICVGLAGVVVALKPSGGFVALGGIVAAISAICYAFNVMAVRLLGRTDSSFAVVLWTLGFTALASGAMCAPHWHPIPPALWPWIGWVGVTGALGQYLFTSAFRQAPATVIAPFEYTALLWGVLLDLLLFGTWPVPRVLLGAAIIVASGLYVIWDERRAGQQHVPEFPA